MKTLYIGEFPPPFGGVTVKNELLKTIYQEENVEFFNLYDCKKNIFHLFELWKKIVQMKRQNGNILLGIGSNSRLERLLFIINLIGKQQLLNRCTIFMMGSTLHEYCKHNVELLRYIKQCRAILTESHGIVNDFGRQLITNVKYLPNCRQKKGEWYPIQSNKENPIRLVFFSKICREKGVAILFEAVSLLKNKNIPFILDFYGVIAPEYETNFYECLGMYEECHYYGVFDAVHENVYEKLHEYDAIVFPSIWTGEGMPGILVESKFAGVPAIVTQHNYNDEIIKDGVDGIVVKSEDYRFGFFEAIMKVAEDREYLYELAKHAYQSQSDYDIMTYKEMLLDYIR